MLRYWLKISYSHLSFAVNIISEEAKDKVRIEETLYDPIESICPGTCSWGFKGYIVERCCAGISNNHQYPYIKNIFPCRIFTTYNEFLLPVNGLFLYFFFLLLLLRRYTWFIIMMYMNGIQWILFKRLLKFSS